MNNYQVIRDSQIYIQFISKLNTEIVQVFFLSKPNLLLLVVSKFRRKIEEIKGLVRLIRIFKDPFEQRL
jgi:hypothetical protein